MEPMQRPASQVTVTIDGLKPEVVVAALYNHAVSFMGLQRPEMSPTQARKLLKKRGFYEKGRYLHIPSLDRVDLFVSFYPGAVCSREYDRRYGEGALVLVVDTARNTHSVHAPVAFIDLTDMANKPVQQPMKASKSTKGEKSSRRLEHSRQRGVIPVGLAPIH